MWHALCIATEVTLRSLKEPKGEKLRKKIFLKAIQTRVIVVNPGCMLELTVKFKNYLPYLHVRPSQNEERDWPSYK